MSKLRIVSDESPMMGGNDSVRLYELIQEEITGVRRFLTGKMLTIADASFADQEQRKAVKDLISEAMWDKYWDMTRHIVYQFISKHCPELLVSDEIDKFFVGGSEDKIRPASRAYFPVLPPTVHTDSGK